MQESNVHIFKNDCNLIRVPKAQVKFPLETKLPCICLFNNENSVGVATEFLKEEDEYLVNIGKNVFFSCTHFDDADVPDKVGSDLYITADGKLTKTKGSNKRVGMFLQQKNSAILFKLD